MNEIPINEKIGYLPGGEDPLSSDIGTIRDGGVTWLFDVGDGAARAEGLTGHYSIVLSHFHRDHTGNVDLFQTSSLFVSKQTYSHVHRGTVVTESFTAGNLRVFPLPSSHAKGCLGLEVDGTYAFVGDALFCRSKGGLYVYNAQLLKDEIAVLKALRAPYLLKSHQMGHVCKKEDAIAELEAIYALRKPDQTDIPVT